MILRLTLLSALTLSVMTPAGVADTTTTTEAVKPAQLPRPQPSKKPKVEYEPNTVLVKFRGTARSAVLRAHGARQVDAIPEIGYVKVRSDAPATELLQKLRNDKSVEQVSLNYARHLDVSPNDPAFQQGYQPYLRTIRMPEAWSITRSSGNQIVAVLDTGVEATHEDLAGKVIRGYNAVRPGASTNDTQGHGTFVAGVIAANTHNRIGVAGVTWNGRIMPIQVFRGDFAYDADVVRGIIYAYSHGARVINMSFGGIKHNPGVQAAIQNATARGVVVVASAGNTGVEQVRYPAAYPGVIAVGATDYRGNLTDFSTRGNHVDLTAPGFDITSTYRGNSYATGAGTSFSAPMVAGVAALLKARNPRLTPAQVLARLQATARDAGPRGIDPYYGRGFLDAYHALGGRWAPELPQIWLREANDVPARATAIPASNSVQGTILMEGDIDWYRFDAVRPVTFRVSPPAFDANRAQNIDPVLAVYDADLKLLGVADDGGLGQAESFSMNVTAGPVYVAVYNYVGAREGRPYTLTANAGPATPRTPGVQVWVNDARPGDYATGVPLNAKPIVKFQRAVDAASVNASTVRLVHGRTGAAIPATVAYDATTRIATITPRGLQDNTPYRISVRGVRDASQTLTYELWSTFRTVNTAPGPVAWIDASGAYPGAVRLAWRLPGITDLDQVVVRRAVGSTPPSSPAAGTAVYAGTASSITATGLASGTSYTFGAWVRDRTGHYSTPAVTRIVGTRVSSAAIPSTVTYGQTVTLTGRVNRVDTGAAVAGHPIFLSTRQHGTSAWRLVGRLTTNASGTATYRYQPSMGRDFIWTYNGSSDLVGSRSGVRPVHVRPVITSNVNKAVIPLGGAVLFYGSVNPKSVGQLVYLQRNIGHGRWVHVTTTRLTSNSTYMFGIRPAVRGTYWFRAVKPADADHLVAVSPTRTFQVR